MLHLSISLRALVFMLLLAAMALTGSDAAHGAPSMANLTADTLIHFQTRGQDVAHDINVADNLGGLRLYGCPALADPNPRCAAIQFFGDGSSGFPGQLFLDSGSNPQAAIRFRTPGAGGAMTERMRITSNGRVGIGTPSPTGAFEVLTSTFATLDQHQTDVSGSRACTNCTIWQSFTAGLSGPLVQLDIRFDASNPGFGTLAIYSGEGTGGSLLASQALAIPDSGWVTVGLAAPPPVVSGTQYTYAVTYAGFMRLTTAGSNAYAGGRHNLDANDDLTFQTYVDTPKPSLFVNAPNGHVGIGTSTPGYTLDVNGAAHATTFVTSSDIRLKTNVKDLTNVLAKIESLRGVLFDWNETYRAMGRASGHREIGLVAQDVEAAFPELVTHWGAEGYAAVDYGRLSGVLVEALKELRSEKDAQIAALEQELAVLRSHAAVDSGTMTMQEENAALKEQVAGLEVRLAALEDRLNGGTIQVPATP